MKYICKITISVFCLIILLTSSMLGSHISIASSNKNQDILCVKIHDIRSLEDTDIHPIDSYQLAITIDNETFISPEWKKDPYLSEINWQINYSYNQKKTFISISFSLYEIDSGRLIPYDIKGNPTNQSHDALNVTIIYNIQTGHWSGDDSLHDPSGYMRLNGCDDGSIYEFERDCEIFFSIYQPDLDGDYIPDWLEREVYESSTDVDDSFSDPDNDMCSTKWEWQWGYDPYKWDDHIHLDSDEDSISNYEEYLCSYMNADPFRKDIFLEMDFMQDSPTGESSVFPEISKELLKNPFHRRNFVFHIDNGKYNGGDMILYADKTNTSDILDYYDTYFIRDESDHWKRGIFHYGLYVYDTSPKGYAFSGDVSPHWGYHPGTNSYVISSSRMERNARWFDKSLAYYYGAATMHEMGHNFGFRWGDPFGVDAQLGKYPWQIVYWIYGNYQSIMNYRYTYKIFDYSDGSHGFLDHDDWTNIDLSYFEFD